MATAMENEQATAPAAGSSYTADDSAYLETLADDTREAFPVGTTYDNTTAVREAVRVFAHSKGFVISSEGFKLSCSRGPEPNSSKTKR